MLVKLIRDSEESFHDEDSESIARFIAAGWKREEGDQTDDGASRPGRRARSQ